MCSNLFHFYERNEGGVRVLVQWINTGGRGNKNIKNILLPISVLRTCR